MSLLKQSTAYTRAFFMVDSSDHLAAKTGLTCTVNISKAGAAFGAAGGTVTEIANGWYKIALTTTDTNTLGDLAYHVTATGADDTDFVDQVVAIDLNDATAFGLSRLDAAISSRQATVTFPTNFSSFSIDASGRVDVAKVAGTAQTARDLGGQLDATVSSRLAPTTAGRTLDVTATGEAGIDWSNIGAPTTTVALSGTTVSAVSGAVGSVTGSIGSLAAQAKADVNAEVDSALDTAIPVSPTANSINERIQTMDNAYTATRGALLDHLDADISSRSTYAGGAVASVTGNVGGNVVGSVGSVAAGGITSSSFGASAIDAAALATDAGQEIADRVLARNIGGGSDTGRIVKEALSSLRNKWTIAAGTLTVYDTDDTTALFTATITTTAGNPVTGSDPA